MKGAGSGVILVVVGLFVIYLGVSGGLKNLGAAWDVLRGNKPATGTSPTGNVAEAPNTGFPITPGVINSITSLFSGSAGASAATATTPGAAAAGAPTVFAAAVQREPPTSWIHGAI